MMRYGLWSIGSVSGPHFTNERRGRSVYEYALLDVLRGPNPD